MHINYRPDPDLEFLSRVSSEHMHPLVTCMTHNEKGERRDTASLPVISDAYKKYYPDHNKYWDEVAGELQTFGANTIATMFRDVFGSGGGVLYRELLIEACEAAKVNFNKNSDVEVIENNLLLKTFENALEKVSQEELQEIVKTMDLKTTNFTKQGVMLALQGAIKLGGSAPYKLALVVANSALNAVGAKLVLGKSARFAINQGLLKGMSKFAGPIGWAITAAWTAYDISGPAKRVTIPACIHVAYLRQMYLYGDLGSNQEQSGSAVSLI